MASPCRIVADDEALVAAGCALVDALEQRWSRFLGTSEISRINAASGQWVTVSADTVLLIERAIEAAFIAGKPPIIVSVHSFTQAWKGMPRPWSVGVLWDKDPRLALPLLAALRTIPDIEVGDNAPYSGQIKGDTLYRHGTGRGLAHALVEVRQDLILGPEGQAEWATRLARALGKVLSDAGAALHTVELHGSITDQERSREPSSIKISSKSGLHPSRAATTSP